MVVIIAVILVTYPLYFYYNGKKNYNDEIAIEIKGLVTNKFQVDKAAKPDVYRLKINDSLFFDLDKGLNDKVEIGDSILKSKGEDFYRFVNPKTKTITRFTIPAPKVW